MKNFFFSFLIILFLSSCSSISEIRFSKKSLLTSLAVGAVSGAALGSISAKKDESKLSWAILGAGLGGTTGAVALSLFPEKELSIKESSTQNMEFFNRVQKEQRMNLRYPHTVELEKL